MAIERYRKGQQHYLTIITFIIWSTFAVSARSQNLPGGDAVVLRNIEYRSMGYVEGPMQGTVVSVSTLTDPGLCGTTSPCLAVVPTWNMLVQTLTRISNVEVKQATLGTTVIQALDRCTTDLKTGTSDAALKQRVETLERKVADLQKQLATKQ
jgi:hypothetical protein